MDKRPVNIISSFPTEQDNVKRNFKDKKSGMYSQLDNPRPTSVGTYNKGMGGTDQCDQKISYYRIRMRSKKWKRKFYTHFINVAIVNCHILYKESRKLVRTDPLFTLKDFIIAVVMDIGFMGRRNEEIVSNRPRQRRSLATCLADPLRHIGFHEPIWYPRIRNEPDLRKKCIWCGMENVSHMCLTCNVPLCMATGVHGQVGTSCFKAFHIEHIHI